MQIYSNLYYQSNINSKGKIKPSDVKCCKDNAKELINLDFWNKYCTYPIRNYQKPVNFEKIKGLKIPNLKQIDNKGFRGESLSSNRNAKFLSQIKKNGISQVIDLRTADTTNRYKINCKEHGLTYHHIPIDAQTTSDREILDNLPKLFKLLENGNFYIACAQGKHRTDIALALNYLFNPKHSKTPPEMIGHVKNGKMRCQDIFTRANSLYKEMTPQDKQMLGWTEKFDKEFKLRKQELVKFNEQ